MEDKKKIMLALQGGGAHTAYVWGVVDRLLERDDLEIVGVGGTSGGAMIAAVLAYGLSLEQDPAGKPLDDRGRRQLTRALLTKFWTDVSLIADASWNPYRFVANPLYPSWNIDGLPLPAALNMLSSVTSPYQSPAGGRKNPVALAIVDCIDLSVLRSSTRGPALYVCATNVRTNQPKIFEKHELQIEHLLASACLPVVDRAIAIERGDGAEPQTDYYWDGGYMADPALAPLIRNHSTETRDLVVVGVNPIVRSADTMPPQTAWQIIDRMNEITFNSSLIAEINRIQSTNELLAEVPEHARARQPGGKLHDKREILIHYVPPHPEMEGLGVASKSNTALPFLFYLQELGRSIAVDWETGRTEGGGASLLGVDSDSNLRELFIDPYHWRAEPLPEAGTAAGGAPAPIAARPSPDRRAKRKVASP
jgi:NTE family protein